MLDDAVLEAMIRDVGESIAVPDDGPERIVAARALPASESAGGPPPGSAAAAGPGSRTRSAVASARRASRRPKTLAVLGLAAAVILAVSVAASRHSSGGSAGSAASAGRASSPVTAAGPAGAAAAAPAGPLQQGASSGPSGPTSPASGPSLPPLPSKVVKTGSVDLQVGAGRLSAAISSMSSETAGLGGFVASTSTTSSAAGSPPGASMTLRVPVASFETLLAFVQKLGTATSVTTSGQDVTSQYVDLQARIQSLQDARTQYQQILAKATTISDILSVEQQLSTLQTQIEQLQGQLNVLDNSATYSSLSVTVTEKAAGGAAAPARRPPGGLSRAWQHARDSFVHGVEAVIGASGGIAVFLLFAGVALVLARAAWILVRRRLV